MCHCLLEQWQSGVNFINILRAAFMPADPKSAKKDSQVNQLFALLGSVSVKAAHRTLMILNPDYLPFRQKAVFDHRQRLKKKQFCCTSQSFLALQFEFKRIQRILFLLFQIQNKFENKTSEFSRSPNSSLRFTSNLLFSAKTFFF